MTAYPMDDITDEERARQEALFRPFTDSVRQLVDATIRTLVDEDEVRDAHAKVDEIVKRLQAEQLEGGFGVRLREGRRGRAWGNAVVGLRNALAPPLTVEKDATGVYAEFYLGAPYEGPPGLVHGGVASLVLDQLLGEAAGAGGRPGMTATLTLRYRRATPLGDLRGEAWIDRTDGHKTWAKGRLLAGDEVTVEAEGLFILPRWARDRLAAAQPSPDRFE